MSAMWENTTYTETSNQAIDTDYEMILLIKFKDKDIKIKQLKYFSEDRKKTMLRRDVTWRYHICVSHICICMYVHIYRHMCVYVCVHIYISHR